MFSKVRLVIVLVLWLAIPVASQAEMFIGSQMAYFEPDDDNFKRDTMTHAMQSGELGYSFNDYLEVLGILSHAKFVSAWDSKFDEVTLIAAARGKYPLTKKLSVYFTAGAGESWFTNKHMETRQVTVESVKADHSIAFIYGPGIQYEINKNLKVFFEADYRYSNTGEGSSLDSWGWSYGGGARWYF